MIEVYSIQQWLFDTAHGRYDIDLAESGVQFQRVADITIDPSWELDYSPDRGEAATREAIASLYGRTSADGVVVSHGAQEALYLLYRSLLRPGDHVVTTTPGWQQAWEVPAAIGCQVGKFTWRPGTPFDVDALIAATTPATTMITLNSPNNPGGRLIDPQAWRRLTDFARSRGIWLVNDEEYLLDFGASVAQQYERGISVSSLSKVYGLPSLRFGWVVCTPEVAEQIVNYKRYTTVSNSLLCERIGTRVLTDRQRHIDRYQRLVDAGRGILDSFARDHAEQLELVEPQGTPFAWCHLRAGRSDEVAERLLAEERTLVMPAEVFGATAGLRISFARPPALLEEGLARVGRQVKKLATP